MRKSVVLAVILVLLMVVQAASACYDEPPKPKWHYCQDGSKVHEGESCPEPKPEPQPQPKPSPKTTPEPKGWGGYNGFYCDVTQSWVGSNMQPGNEIADGVFVTQSAGGQWGCEQRTTVVPPPAKVFYGNCDPKILVTRLNNGTNQTLDPSDIIGISHPDNPAARELWNVSQSWGDTFEGKASLSWDSCWFAVERYVDGNWTIWWSDFSSVHPVKVHGEIVKGRYPDVGKHGEILYTDTSSGQIEMTDRAGSFLRDYKLGGTYPEFNHDGTRFSYRDRHGMIQEIGVDFSNAQMVSEGSLSHSDPNAQRLFYRNGKPNLDAWVNNLNIAPLLRDTLDVAIEPGSMESYDINVDHQLRFSKDWPNVVGTTLADPWDTNTSDTRQAVFSHPDWRN